MSRIANVGEAGDRPNARQGRIVIRSVGVAGAGIVGALRQALPFTEERLAACVYQAPAELVGSLDMSTAEAVAQALRAAGLEVDVLDVDQPFTSGGPDYDVALVIRQFDRLVEVAGEIANFLGVTPDRARQMLYTCPTELIGKVSANTVEAIRRRFQPLGVTVDASRRENAQFDIFLSACAEAQQDQAERILREAGLEADRSGLAERLSGCIRVGVCKDAAEAVWRRAKPAAIPLRILNRDFQRFDLRLEQAPDTPEMIAFLVDSAGMPDRVALKIPGHTPIVTHHYLGQHEALDLLDRIAELGGRASAQLLAMQSFRLQLARIGDADSTIRLLEVLGGVDSERARTMVRSMGTLERPATAYQARWLQHELRRVGTDVRMLLA